MNDYSDPAAYWQHRLAHQFDLTGAGFANLGPRYNAHLYRARIRALERALTKVNCSVGDAKVLEVGCGTGYYTAYFEEKGVTDYVGVDITPVSVNTLRRRFPSYTFRQTDVTKPIDGQEQVFDVALAADVFFHIMSDDAFRAAIRNLGNWIKKDGMVVISDIFPGVTVQTATHVRNRSLDDYVDTFSEHGFQLRHIEPIFAILHPPMLIPGTLSVWRAYARVWQYGWRLARWSPLDRLLPQALEWLDDHLFLPNAGAGAPNSKWLVAVRSWDEDAEN